MTSLFVAVPCYGGQMHSACTISLLHLQMECAKINIVVAFDFLMNESLIPRGRNALVYDFMQCEYTHLLFVDADIQFDPFDVINMIKADKDIIGGAYAKKELLWNNILSCAKKDKDADALQYNTSDYVFTLKDVKDLNKTAIPNPVEAKCVGTGLMLIKRNVFVKIKEHYPLRSYMHKNATHYCYFDCTILNNEYLSEDYFFCQLWRELGGKVFVALWTKTSHYGTLPVHTDISKKNFN